MMRIVKENLTCPAALHVLNPSGECYKDFVDMKKIDTTNVPKHLVESGAFAGVQQVGLISFLGWEDFQKPKSKSSVREMSFIAGGVNAIDAWADAHNCGAPDPSHPVANVSFDFIKCSRLLQKHLYADVLFKEVTKFFKIASLHVRSFSYTTFAANPSGAVGKASDNANMKLLHNISGKVHRKVASEDFQIRTSSGSSLFSYVQARCISKLHNSKWGGRNERTCMNALFTSMYITSFFDSSHFGDDHLYFDRLVDWSRGLKSEVESGDAEVPNDSPVAAFLETSVGTSVQEMLHQPLSWHAVPYTIGAALHLTEFPLS